MVRDKSNEGDLNLDEDCGVLCGAAPIVCCKHYGGLAQLVEHLLCKQGVNGSNPLFSTFKEIIDMVGTQNEKIKRFY